MSVPCEKGCGRGTNNKDGICAVCAMEMHLNLGAIKGEDMVAQVSKEKRICACGCKEEFQPTGNRQIYAPGHSPTKKAKGPSPEKKRKGPNRKAAKDAAPAATKSGGGQSDHSLQIDLSSYPSLHSTITKFANVAAGELFVFLFKDRLSQLEAGLK